MSTVRFPLTKGILTLCNYGTDKKVIKRNRIVGQLIKLLRVEIIILGSGELSLIKYTARVILYSLTTRGTGEVRSQQKTAE